MTPDQVAAEHYERQVALARQAGAEAQTMWSRVQPGNIAASWLGLVETLATVLSAAQAIAASAAGPYLQAIADSFGLRPERTPRVNATAFAGVASDGRDLETLLYQPAIRTLAVVGSGTSTDAALVAGGVELDMIVRTQVADAGRVADGVALTAHRQMTGYVRMLNPPSCSRCIILAGRRYGWSAGFRRHPR